MTVPNELANSSGTTLADEECPECEGPVWNNGSEKVCGDCSAVVSADPERRDPDEWEKFHDDRPEHWNSEQKRCVGGFPWVYDWIRSDEIDSVVAEVDPENFYR